MPAFHLLFPIVQPSKKQNRHIHSDQYDFSAHIPKETLSLTSESAYPDRMLPPLQSAIIITFNRFLKQKKDIGISFPHPH